MPNLDLTATATALDCQRQFTARSSKGMSMDPAAPERTLSSHIDADCDNAPNNSFMNLEDLNGFHDCIIRSNRQRQTHASSANTFLTPCMCHSTDLDYANLLSGTTPVDQPSYYKTTHDANHRSSPIFFNPSSRCTTTFPSVSANQLNNSDLLLHQHQTIAPTAERRDEHNYQMSFSDSAHAGSNTKELCTSGLDTPQPIRRRPSKSKSKKHRQKHRLKSPPPVSVPAAPANVVSTFVRTPRSTTKHQQRSTTKHQQRSITNQQQRSITNQQQRSTTKHQQRSITNHQQRSITNHQQRSITNHQQRSITNHRRSLSSSHMGDANNSELLLHQRTDIEPAIQRRNRHNYQMNFTESAHAGSFELEPASTSASASSSSFTSYGARTSSYSPTHTPRPTTGRPQHLSSKQPSSEFATATAAPRDSVSLRIPMHASIPKLLHRVDGYNSSSDDSSDYEDGEIVNSPRSRRKHEDGYHNQQTNMSNGMGLHHKHRRVVDVILSDNGSEDDEEEDGDEDEDEDEDDEDEDDDDGVDGDYSDEDEEDVTHSDVTHSDGSHSDGSHSDGSHSDGSHSDGSHSSNSLPPAPSAKFSRQSISLVPGKGVNNVYDFTAKSLPLASASSASSATIRYETGLSVDSLSSDDDDDVIVVDDSDSGGGCSEVHRVDSSFWSSSSCPTGLYLVAHTEDSAHVIEDCKQGQVYVFQQLTTIQHLQLVRKTLGPYLRSTLSSHVPVHLYRNSRDHSNSFCVVLNTVESVSPVIDSLDFVAMHEILSNVDPKTVHGRKRQEDQTRVSYGFATNTSQKRDESGSAVPNLLRGTMSDFTRQLFVIMSSIFFLSFLPSWAKYRGDPKRQVYAKIIAPDNEIEGLTLHKSSPSNLCNGHMDSNNPDYVEGSEDSQLSLVVGASKWVEGERVGLTGYFRKSLTSSMERKIKNAPMLEELHSIYSQLPSDRKHIDPSTFKVFKKEGNYLDKQHVSVPCNVDPLGTTFNPKCIFSFLCYFSLFPNIICIYLHVLLYCHYFLY
jgi:hypothetical protein